MRLAVIGAGEMGHGIAELAALHGHEVVVRDINQEFLTRGMEKIRWSLDKLVEKNRIRPEQRDETLARIRLTTDLREACRNADIVIEAVFEDLDLKKQIFQELDQVSPKGTVLASNTSALPITKMAQATKRPDKVVGMHFFNPPMLMPLVEVIRADTTSDTTLEAALGLAKSLGKTVVVVRKDVPGFITTRVLGPYFEEAAWIHDGEGVPIEAIDASMRFRGGFPMGPFELADQVGIDVLHHLIQNAGRPMPRSVQALIAEKKLGRKVGGGFYMYKTGRPHLTPEMDQGFDPIRILAPVIAAAAELVAMDVAGPAEIDEAMRLGTAFPKGPLATADDLGIDVVLAALRNHPRARPPAILEEMVARGDLGVKSGRGFYEHRGKGASATYETLLVVKEPASHVATITINRPDRLNTLSPQVFADLDRAIAELETDDAVRCVAVTGAGDRSFSAGADLTSLGDVSKSFKVWRLSRRSEDVLGRLANLPKPTVAAINGHCFGGGLELALACDFRIAAKRATLGQTEVNLGLVPGAGGSQRLVRILGQARAKELVMLGSRLTADEAAAIGLVTKSVDNDAFPAEVRAFADKLAKQAPLAIRLAKILLNRGGDMSMDAALEMEAMAFGLVTSTEDVFEGLQAFMEKREPKFKGSDGHRARRPQIASSRRDDPFF
jgi:enoyl-CoA hydratase/3-hydroxyacyl-CoA dehydrogenase